MRAPCLPCHPLNYTLTRFHTRATALPEPQSRILLVGDSAARPEGLERFRRLGLTGIETRLGDGAAGWLEAAPFQGILVTAAAPHVPQPLADQLAPGGRLVIPIGDLASQELVIWERSSDGKLRERRAGGVRFVPLISRLAFTEEPEWR